jgi:predicted PurR-regulated permease PerM
MALPPINPRRTELPGTQKSSSVETLAVVAAVVTALYLGRAIAIPIAIAVLISFSLGPAVTWLRRHRCGRFPSIFIAVVPALLALATFAYVVTVELGHLAENIPAYQANIETKIARAKASLPSPAMIQRGSAFIKGLSGVPDPAPVAAPDRSSGTRGARGRGAQTVAPTTLTPQSADKPVPVEIRNPEPGPVDLLRSVIDPLIGPLSSAALVLLFTIFFLAEREALRDRIIRLAGAQDLNLTTMAMDEATYRVSRFLLHQTAVNVAFGIAITLGLYLLGLPNAALWGGIAAILRFIPYFGIALSAVLPLALAFAVDPGWTMLLWTGGLFLALELVVGNLIEPWLYGSSTGLSAVALVVSAIFWTWLWGTTGLLLATPLTVCIAVVGRYVPQLAFLDVLLGNQAPLKPEESFYQRLLAGHPAEAADQAEDYLRTRTPLEFYDEVALPALIRAEHDRGRGALDQEHVRQVIDSLKIVMANLEAETARPSAAASKVEAEDEASDLTLCVAGKGELDQAASTVLARLLEDSGHRVMTLPYNSGIRIVLPDIAEHRIKTVCLSYLAPESAAHARYLARRYRRRLGAEVTLIVALWGFDSDEARRETTRAETSADLLVTSFQSAIAAIDAGPAARHPSDEDPEPDLGELAERISAVMSRDA